MVFAYQMGITRFFLFRYLKLAFFLRLTGLPPEVREEKGGGGGKEHHSCFLPCTLRIEKQILLVSHNHCSTDNHASQRCNILTRA